MTKYRFLIIVLCLMSGLVLAEVSEAPYLYYYSHALNGIVIERADGTDSRLIGQGLIQDPKQLFAVAATPGWSPDGRWFGWITWHLRGWNEGAVVSVDGITSLPILRQFACVYIMEWSPDSRYLLVYGIVDQRERVLECNEGGRAKDFWLIEVSTGEQVASFTAYDDYFLAYYDYHERLDLTWLRDEVQFSSAERLPDDDEYISIQISLRFDGIVTKTPLETGHMLLVMDPPVDSEAIDDYEPMPASPDGRYQLISDEFDEERALMDTITGQRIEFPWHSSAVDDVPITLRWLSSEWVILGYEACFADCSPWVGHISLFNPATRQYRETSDCRAACIDVLPEQVDLAALPDGRDEPMLLMPDRIGYEFDEVKHSLGWLSEQATHQLACNKKARDPEFWLGEMTQVQTLEGATVFTLPHNFLCASGNFFVPIEFDTGALDPAILALSPDGRYAALADNKHFAELYDVKTHERLATLNIGAISLWFSEDSRTLYTRSRFAVAEWDVAEVIAHARGVVPS
jgi:hypothetical protein